MGNAQSGNTVVVNEGPPAAGGNNANNANNANNQPAGPPAAAPAGATEAETDAITNANTIANSGAGDAAPAGGAVVRPQETYTTTISCQFTVKKETFVFKPVDDGAQGGSGGKVLDEEAGQVRGKPSSGAASGAARVNAAATAQGFSTAGFGGMSVEEYNRRAGKEVATGSDSSLTEGESEQEEQADDADGGEAGAPASAPAGSGSDAAEPDRRPYSLSFQFDASVDTVVSVYYMARPTTERTPGTFDDLFETIGSVTVPKLEFSAGMDVQYAVPAGHEFVPAAYDEAELVKTSAMVAYPVVVVAETAPMAVHQGVQHQVMTTYCTLTATGGRYAIRVLKQIVQIADCYYLLHDIFGVVNDDDDESNECVVCITDPRDTAVLPCRHLCLCAPCAKQLRQRSNRCPICRVPFQSLLQFKLSKLPSEDSDSDPDSDIGHRHSGEPFDSDGDGEGGVVLNDLTANPQTVPV
ncbi:uncharacterized protein AMSG_02388 [Thecamonas trahens ATCC 50062]|uniref:RING-type E3 ubiquitin transferase n=1 Tax=Thecamonas trahens ATCC 50062 TaxID=461836 RepID=A0A0L0DW62_THETB|nr:hypothetical protein AMSG_02388 [Thecamonas trahens ATCC 50062]KNC56417.1 hypothetical protein AMSG_02388 [Thecamonas trahens ATCC 50062]|eukprot:XP_013760930.1 hypothetical protein AMSG_02388 [Thecamonas trahens ATCC 50062]